jgi:hypothetical protein
VELTERTNSLKCLRNCCKIKKPEILFEITENEKTGAFSEVERRFGNWHLEVPQIKLQDSNLDCWK